MSPEDRIRLWHMLEAARTAHAKAVGLTKEAFLADRVVRGFVERMLMIVGEAAARVSEETRNSAPNIPWLAIVGLRNRLVHVYFDIIDVVVWETASRDLPPLIDELIALAGEPPEEDDAA
jgi:uncharacterized protein with HEPN domain